MLSIGRMYLFMTQRYIYSGTVVQQTPTHVMLGDDAQIHYDDVGDLGEWAVRRYKQGSKVPGQVVSMVATEATPIGAL